MKTLYGQVFRYGISTGRAKRDPTADFRGALKLHKTKHLAAITDTKEIPALLNALDSYSGQPVLSLPSS